MRIACFSDLHAHAFKEFDVITDKTGSQRLDNIIHTLDYIREWCCAEGINTVLFAGDLFHVRARVDTIVFNSTYDAIKRFYEDGISMIMIAGNHDQKDHSDVPQNSLHAFKQLPGVYVYDTVGRHILNEYNQYVVKPRIPVSDPKVFCDIVEQVEIVMAPYTKNAQMVKDYIANVEKDGTTKILLFHLGIDGGFVGNGNYAMADAFKVEDLCPDKFKYVIGGHFHIHQILGGYNHVFYCGSPIEHSFGDEGEDKGFLVVDTNRKWDVKLVPIPNPKFYTIKGDVDEGWPDKDILQTCVENGHYVRFLVNEKQMENWKAIIPEGLKYKVELQKEYVEQSRSNVKVGMTFEEMISNYADENNPEAKQIGLDILKEVEGT